MFFDTLLHMHSNIPTLEKKAIKLALNDEWEEAIVVNKEIIAIDAHNVNAKLRLGRAYLQQRDFKKAEKLFKEVLDIDPINTVAQKNYEYAKSKKTQNATPKANNGKALVKEPGTTVEVNLTISAKGVTANSFSYCEEFGVTVFATKANVLCDNKTIGEIKDGNVVKRLNSAKKQAADLSALFIKGEGKNIKILLQSSEPVFKGDKQDIKPYMKKGTIEEPELEIISDDFDE